MYLVVLSTWACNLNCSYCKVKKRNFFISEEILKKSIDYLLASKDEELKFEFFGGEPLLLQFKLLKKIILYGNSEAKKRKKKMTFIITTNAILLNEEKIRFFKKNKVLLIISLDGTKESQDINRPQVGGMDSYSRIIENLPMIFKEKVPCYCYTVVTPETVNDLEKNFLSLVNLGFKKIWLMMACGPVWDAKAVKSLKKGLKRISEIYPELLLKKKIVYLDLVNWNPPFPFNTELSVNTDGFIYSACLTYLIDDEKQRRQYILGDINNLKESIDELNKKRLTNDQAIEIVYKEFNRQRLANKKLKPVDLLENNIRSGKIMTKFINDLKKKIFDDKKLKQIYEEESKA
jgi:uncharacterized Fe-S cluster-containing radical SAM superfamily protein